MSPLLLEAAQAWRECRLYFSDDQYWLRSLSQGDHAEGEPAREYTRAIQNFFGTDHETFGAWAMSASARHSAVKARPSLHRVRKTILNDVRPPALTHQPELSVASLRSSESR